MFSVPFGKIIINKIKQKKKSILSVFFFFPTLCFFLFFAGGNSLKKQAFIKANEGLYCSTFPIMMLKKKLAVWKMEQFYTPSPHYNNTCRHTWRLTFSTSSSYFCKNITKVEDGGDSWIRQSKWWVNWKPGFWAKKKTNRTLIPFLPFFSHI